MHTVFAILCLLLVVYSLQGVNCEHPKRSSEETAAIPIVEGHKSGEEEELKTSTEQEDTGQDQVDYSNLESQDSQPERNSQWVVEVGEPWLTGFLNRTDIEKVCKLPTRNSRCWASDVIVPLCANDNKTYLNPGVLQCAQLCNGSLEGEYFGECKGHIRPTRPTTTPPPPPPPPPHQTSPDRIRILGVVARAARAIGLHVHDDGGIYLADEKENDSWWNI